MARTAVRAAQSSCLASSSDAREAQGTHAARTVSKNLSPQGLSREHLSSPSQVKRQAKRHCPSVTQRAVGKGEVFTRQPQGTPETLNLSFYRSWKDNTLRVPAPPCPCVSRLPLRRLLTGSKTPTHAPDHTNPGTHAKVHHLHRSRAPSVACSSSSCSAARWERPHGTQKPVEWYLSAWWRRGLRS